MTKKDSKEFWDLSHFPAKSSKLKRNQLIIKEYDYQSLYDQLAMMSHYYHNYDELSDSERRDIKSYISNTINHIYPESRLTDTDISAEEWTQMDLFTSLIDVPFPNRKINKFRFIDLFAGIGGIRLPFSELGGKCVFSSEWDKHAQSSYIHNYGEVPFGDITKIREDFIPAHDILLAGFPCQAFSIIGKMKGFEDTRGTLFFDVARILKYHKPKAFLLENVKQLVTHDKGNTFRTILHTLEDLGYHVKWKILNALDFGVPQKRERTIIVGFLDQDKYERFNFDFTPRPYDLSAIIENDNEVDSSLFASEDIRIKRLQRIKGKKVFYPSIWHENKSGNISILPYACALRTGASYNYLLVNGYRRPSSRELLRLQGFPEKFEIVVSHSEIRRQTGNSVAVPMIREVAKKIVELL